MSELRKQLQSLKDEYKSARYPGDLAFELLAPKRPIGRIVGFSAIGVGIAAAVALWIMHGTIPTQPGPGKPTVIVKTIAPATQPAVEYASVPATDLASAPEFPSDMDLVPSDGPTVPSATSFDFGSMPSMPSMSLDFSTDDTSSSAKES